MPKILSKQLTSYDLLKTVAVILMIVDHAGFYFFPDDNWWRVAGRLCVPVWFFLIGYANSRDLGKRLWIGMAVLICADLIAGLYLFPVNILGSMIITRLALDPLMERALRDRSRFWAIAVILLLLTIPSGMGFEYGTLGFILAIYGYLIRRRKELTEAGNGDFLRHYFLFATACFLIVQSLAFGFKESQQMVLMLGTLGVMSGLFFFRPMEFPLLSAKLPRFLVLFLQFTGRRTLEIYVAHQILFKSMGMALDPERFALFQWKLVYGL